MSITEHDLPAEADDTSFEPPVEEQSDRLYIPNDSLVCFEHPCVIKDIDRAVAVLGGEYRIKQVFQTDEPAVTQATSLRPHDIFAKPIPARRVPVDHVLLRVVLPRLTGRKRKRGTDDPYEFHGGAPPASATEGYDAGMEMPLQARELLERIKKGRDLMEIEPVGIIKDSHRFRGLADIQYVAQDGDVMRQVASHLLKPNLSRIKTFAPNMAVNIDVPNIVGPPGFMQTSQPLYYGYAQGPGAKTILDSEGNARSSNVHAPLRRKIKALPISMEQVPTERPSEVLPIKDCPEGLQKIIRRLETLLEEHPIITRRAAMNLLAPIPETQFKDATQYVSYSFASGPWKDALIRFGVDPRKDPELRKYQCLTFQLSKKDKNMAAASKMTTGSTQWLRAYKVARHDPSANKTESHLFNGRTIGTDNKTFQILHIIDPLLSTILADAPLRAEPDLGTDGWFNNGTMSLIRGIMRDKMALMLSGQDPDTYSELYSRIVRTVPTIITPANVESVFLTEDEGLDRDMKQRGVQIITSIRSLGKGEWNNSKSAGPAQHLAKATKERSAADAQSVTDAGTPVSEDRRQSVATSAASEDISGMEDEEEPSDDDNDNEEDNDDEGEYEDEEQE